MSLLLTRGPWPAFDCDFRGLVHNQMPNGTDVRQKMNATNFLCILKFVLRLPGSDFIIYGFGLEKNQFF